MSIRLDVLNSAKEIVDGPRNNDYGEPEDSFKLIAQFWNTYLLDKYNFIDIQGHDVAIMLVLLKIARLSKSGGSHIDSWVDVAGYAACGYESFLGNQIMEETNAG